MSKSTSGYAFILGGEVVWCSKTQDCIALSTMKVEYIVCGLVLQEAMWLRHFLQDLNLTLRPNDPVEMYCDNTGAIDFSNDSKFHKKTKHIKRHYHFVRDVVIN